MLSVDNQGQVEWLPEIERRISPSDHRKSPIAYILRCGPLPCLEEFNPILEVDDLVSVGPDEFVTDKEEVTRVDGLLRIVDVSRVVIDEPRNLVLVGALTPNSLMATLVWLKRKGWSNCQVHLVDNSPVPIETTRALLESGYINWPAGINLVEEDVFKCSLDQRPDIIIGDILNTWMIPHYYPAKSEHKSPYERYQNFLKWAGLAIKTGGWFFSRCLILPEKAYAPNQEATFSQQVDWIERQLGILAQKTKRLAIETAIRKKPGRPQSTNENLKTTLVGIEAEEAFTQLYRQQFDNFRLIKVTNRKSGYLHLNFMCKIHFS